jgi:hypothetical protein
VTTDISIGQAAAGTVNAPPESALTACQWNSYLLDRAVWIPASMDISYSGSVSAIVQVVGSLVTGADAVIVDDAGNVTCTNQQWTAEMNPGQSVSLQAWVALRIVSNTHPQFEPSDLDSLAWTTYAVDSSAEGSSVRAQGPGAIQCGPENAQVSALLLDSEGAFPGGFGTCIKP